MKEHPENRTISLEELLDKKYGQKGSASREAFEGRMVDSRLDDLKACQESSLRMILDACVRGVLKGDDENIGMAGVVTSEQLELFAKAYHNTMMRLKVSALFDKWDEREKKGEYHIIQEFKRDLRSLLPQTNPFSDEPDTGNTRI